MDRVLASEARCGSSSLPGGTKNFKGKYMALSVGVVGLPNVGKSTFFNAITNAGAAAANYPFCTIDPNKGIVPIRDERLNVLAEMNKSENIIHATIEFVDIAGLVKGASKGEGLGNKFLSHIQEVSAIAHIVRCFDDPDIIHVNGKVNPKEDIEIINLELILADIDILSKMIDTASKKAKVDNEYKERLVLMKKIQEALEKNIPARNLIYDESEMFLLKTLPLLTLKKVVYVANVDDKNIGKENDFTKIVKKIAEEAGDEFAIISAKIEEEIAQLSSEERIEYLKELGIPETGLDVIAHKCFKLLGLQTFLTAGKKETRAWTIKKGDLAPQAAGVIHSDFEKGFIRANVVSYPDYVANNGLVGARAKGLLRQEGKTYVMQEGDIVEFLFNV
ncbi:GTP-dependent nucleic acid-binding protein engD [Candidatus Omnitrophus magneticus]|uniref:Ribosome-binding ATPase YchF n=1 Tax=Candidatus Omnitrophus magneticus TaxID=1609969 RepID=A0A0F0CWK6_9BACT|nr:GTP-dependent nucleic acid-binding protein engD [Candidatus Omnitrophus magneticus]